MVSQAPKTPLKARFKSCSCGLRTMLGLGRHSLGRRTPSAASLTKTKEVNEKAAGASPKTAAMPASVHSTANGAANGQSREYAESSSTHSYEANGQAVTRTNSQVSIVRHTIHEVRGKVQRECGVAESYFSSMSIEEYLGYITHLRLVDMPHKGDKWDRVLKSAEYFGLQISAFAEFTDKFIGDSKIAADVALANCRLLLELGIQNRDALVASFGVFYKLGLGLSPLLRNRELFTASHHVKEQLAYAYSDLLHLVADVAIYYRKRVNDLAAGAVSLDFYGIFGRQVTSFHNRKASIINAMWSFKLDHNAGAEIQSVRDWLSPRDHIVQHVCTDRLDSKSTRTEFTCEWMQRFLLDFFRSDDDVLAISGEPGCGKTVLSGWVEERLQRPMSRQNYETISYTFESDMPSETTSLALVKGLLLQLLDRNIGDVSLYKGLVHAYERSRNSGGYSEVEEDLWKAFVTGVQTVASAKANLVILIDGLDDVAGGDPSAVKIFKRLQALTEKHQTVRSVIFSRPVDFPKSKGVRHLHIKADHVRDDISRLIKDTFKNHGQYTHRTNEEKDKIVDKILDTAKASFLWATLVLEILTAQPNDKSFQHALDHIPTTLQAVFEHIAGRLDFRKTETKHVFAWLLAAERPFTLKEMRELLAVNIEKKALIERQAETQDEIAVLCGSFVEVRKGIVRFRHRAVRDYVLRLPKENKVLLAPRAGHTDLTTRLVLYLRIVLKKPYHPSFDKCDVATVDDHFHSHVLLEYAVRYWTNHFRESTMYSKDRLNCSDDFKSAFPGSTFFVLLEWACWESQSTVREAIELHLLSLHIRRAVFGEEHECVLQSLITLAILYRAVSYLDTAAIYFYRASTCGQKVLRLYSDVTVTCTERFLSCTEDLTITTRTEVVTYREHMLRFIIEVCKHRHGAHSDAVISYYRLLVALYKACKEEEHVTRCSRELYEIIVIRFGKSSKQARECTREEDLPIVLKPGREKKEVDSYTCSIFETVEETLEVWDVRRIRITLELIASYEACGDVFRAEQLFITLWARITEACHGKKHVDIHVACCDVAIAYYRFLERLQRKEEATSILICIWREYSDITWESETLIVRLKEIGVLLKVAGVVSIAISIFSGIWAWCKRTGKTEHEHATSTTVLISETLEEEIKTTKTVTVKEEIVREVFESTFTYCKTTKKYTELHKACKSLTVYLIQEKRYAEAIEIIHRTLEVTCSVVLTSETNIKISAEHVHETVLIIHRLAHCHEELHHFDLALKFYLRAYRACLASCHVHDELVATACSVLVDFYTRYHREHEIKTIYIELLKHYRAHLDAKHHLIIQLLYKLASLSLSCGWTKEAYEYYAEIVLVLNKGSKTCHHQAIEAAVVLIRWYHEEKRWKELQETCHVLWETFLHDHHNHVHWKEETVITIFQEYRYVLEFHAKVQISVLYKLSVEFREVCVKIFAAESHIHVVCLLEQASICEKSEEHYHEAVTIYEKIIREKRTTTVTTVTTTEIKRRLTRTYLTITKSSLCSTSTIERAITVVLERFEALKVELGCWHESVLVELKELVLLSKKMKTKESHTTCIRMLQNICVEILTTVTITERLYSSAIHVAQVYLACELYDEGFELLRQLRFQLILRDSKGCGFTLPTTVGRASYVFLVAFELTLRSGKGCTYAGLYTDLLTETSLYESFWHAIKSQHTAEVVISRGALLRVFLVTRKRERQLEALDAQLYEIFVKHFGSSVTTKQSVTFVFYLALLHELGRDRVHHHGLGHAACIASTDKVKLLIEEGKFQEAHDVALCAFQFIRSQGAYKDKHNIGYGWKLSLYLAGRNVNCRHENKLRDTMLTLSREVLVLVLAACREAHIDFVAVKFEELNDLIGLLAAQRNWADLDWLLEQLWSSRRAQSEWPQERIILVGIYLVHARYHSGRAGEAVKLCEDMVYNLRRALGYGPLHHLTLRLTKLLSTLYTDVGRHRDAMAVHEEVLRLALYGDDDGEDDGAVGTDALAGIANEHLEWLKRTYQRLGEWDKSPQMYKTLHHELHHAYNAKLTVPSPDKWSVKGADALGTYTAPAAWDLVARGETAEGRAREEKRKRKSLLARARESWFGPHHHHHHHDQRRSVVV